MLIDFEDGFIPILERNLWLGAEPTGFWVEENKFTDISIEYLIPNVIINILFGDLVAPSPSGKMISHSLSTYLFIPVLFYSLISAKSGYNSDKNNIQ